MHKDKKIGVVVPTYNEGRLIESVLKAMPDYVDRVYVVDDASTDNTSGIILNISRQNDKVTIITHEKNRGVGAAIVSGYKKALEDGMDITAVMAGDNQMDSEQLPNLLEPIIGGNASYTKGNRLLSPEYRKGMSKWRFLGNSLLTFLTKMSSGYWQLMDPQNGYTAISRDALERVSLNSIYPRYGYCNDLLVKLNVYGFRVLDVLMPARYGRERSKIKYSTYIPRVSWLLLKDFFWRLKMKYVVFSFHPLVFFYIFGIILTPIGLLGILYSLYYKYVLGGDLFIRIALSLLLFMIGIQFLFFAMLFDTQVNEIENRR